MQQGRNPHLILKKKKTQIKDGTRKKWKDHSSSNRCSKHIFILISVCYLIPLHKILCNVQRLYFYFLKFYSVGSQGQTCKQKVRTKGKFLPTSCLRKCAIRYSFFNPNLKNCNHYNLSGHFSVLGTSAEAVFLGGFSLYAF